MIIKRIASPSKSKQRQRLGAIEVERRYGDPVTVVVQPSNSDQIKKEEAGRKAWTYLHTTTDEPEIAVRKFESMIPSYGCTCRQDYAKLKETYPLDCSSPDAFFLSGVALHNAVNRKLNKPELSIDEARCLWLHEAPKTSKRLILSLAIGAEAAEIYRITGENHRAYANRVGADYVCLTNKMHSSWQMDKLRASYFALQYDWILWVDSDVLFMPGCPNIFEEFCNPRKVYGCDDLQYLSNYVEAFQKEIDDVMKSQGMELVLCNRMVNSGFVLASRESASWRMPERDLPTTHCSEQLWHDYWIGDKFEEIDRRWNWQPWQADWEAGVDSAYVLHLAGKDHEWRINFLRNGVSATTGRHHSYFYGVS
jgi:hypothetical protein